MASKKIDVRHTWLLCPMPAVLLLQVSADGPLAPSPQPETETRTATFTCEEVGCRWSAYSSSDWGYYDESGSTSLDGCKTACLERSDCTGVEWVADSYCAFWYSGNCAVASCGSSNPGWHNWSDGVTCEHIQEGNTTVTPVTCKTETETQTATFACEEGGCRWSAYSSSDWGYYDESGSTSLDGCKTACLERSDCTGVEWVADSYCAFWYSGNCAVASCGSSNPGWHNWTGLTCEMIRSGKTVACKASSRASCATTATVLVAALHYLWVA